VEVVKIDPQTKTFSIVVKVTGSPMQIHTPKMKNLIAMKVCLAVRYLVTEGFMPGPKENEWTCEIIGIAV